MVSMQLPPVKLCWCGPVSKPGGMGMSWEGSVGEELKIGGGVEVTGSVDTRALSHCAEA